MLLVPYFWAKALLVFVNKNYYCIALDYPKLNLLLQLLFADLCQKRSAGETDVVDLCSLILLYTEHITVGEISIYFCIKQHQISRNRSVKNVTVFTWEVNSLDSVMGRVGNKGMYAAF